MKTDAIRGYSEVATLRDGGSLLVRAVQPGDKALIKEMFRRLSADSIRYRTFSP